MTRRGWSRHGNAKNELSFVAEDVADLRMFDDGKVWFATRDGCLFSMEGDTPKLVARHRALRRWPRLLGCCDDQLLVAGRDDSVLRVDRRDGSVALTRLSGEHMLSEVGCFGSSIVYSRRDDQGVLLRMHDVARDETLWEKQIKGSGPSFLIHRDGLVFLTETELRTVVARRVLDGRVAWKAGVGAMGDCTGALGEPCMGWVRREIFTSRGLVIIGVESHYILALDGVSGKLVWSVRTEDARPYFVLDELGERIMVIDYTVFRVLDARSGGTLLSADLRDGLHSLGIDVLGMTPPVILGSDVVAVQCEEGLALFIDHRTGALVRSVELGVFIPVWNHPVVCGKRLYLLSKSHRLFALA